MTDDTTTTAASAARKASVPARERALSIEREAAAGMDQGMRVLSYLISGVVFYGLLGWLGDHLLGTKFLLPVGIVGGSALAVYMIIRRFGQVPEVVLTKATRTSGTPRPTSTTSTTSATTVSTTEVTAASTPVARPDLNTTDDLITKADKTEGAA